MMSNQSNNTQSGKKRKHRLEIQVFEADYTKSDTTPEWRPVRGDPVLDGGRPNIIEVADKAEFDELQKHYALCDQRIQVIREIDPFVDEPIDKPQSAQIPANNKAIPIQSVSATCSCQEQPAMQASPQQPIQTPANSEKPKPKIVTIGDIEVKYDGDKVYQKQWMKLTPIEAGNFRVVNDSNNKIVNLNGKHIEAKRWILVEENSTTTDDNSIENLIEG